MTAATKPPGLDERRARGLRWYEGGQGPALVLLHGLGGAAGTFLEVSEALARSHRVLAPDLPGHGGSESLPGADVAAFADAVAALLEAPALVAGHSFGGQVALRLAQRRPELVRGLLLVAPSGISTGSRAAQAIVAASARVRPGRVAARLGPRYAARPWFRRAIFRPWFAADADALAERVILGLLASQPEHADTWTAGRAMVADDPREELAGIRCPALVLAGADDAQVPTADAFEYARRLRAPVRLVADCGHLVIVERPRAVLDGVRHLEKLVRDAEALRE